MAEFTHKMSIETFNTTLKEINDFVDDHDGADFNYWGLADQDKVKAWILWLAKSRGEARGARTAAHADDEDYRKEIDTLIEDACTAEGRCKKALEVNKERGKKM